MFDRVQDDPDSVTSVFTKVTDTFYTQRQECRTACGHAAYKLL